MKIKSQIKSLKELTTFRMGGEVTIYNLQNEKDVESFALQNLKFKILGGGSNILVSNKDLNVSFIKYTKSDIRWEDNLIMVDAGKNWDELVEETVAAGYYTLAALSLIPGTVGAAPVQNIGAYGTEVSESIIKVKGYDYLEKTWRVYSNQDCKFGYRKSRFQKNHNFLITSVTFKLNKDINKIPTEIRDTVIHTRDSKLPRVQTQASVGSFFKNPIVQESILNKILLDYKDMPHYPQKQLFKLAAGWLIEHAECRDIKDDTFFLYEKNCLVITHRNPNPDLNNLMAYAKKIQNRVYERFEIKLEIEPEIIK